MTGIWGGMMMRIIIIMRRLLQTFNVLIIIILLLSVVWCLVSVVWHRNIIAEIEFYQVELDQ